MITGHWYMILALMLIVLIFYGPGKLPEIGGAVGKGIREFRKSVDGVTSKVSDPVSASEAADNVNAPANDVSPANSEVKSASEVAGGGRRQNRTNRRGLAYDQARCD